MDLRIIDLDHVQIAAPPNSEVEARRFFGSLLGLTEIEKPEHLRPRGGCWFQVGQRQLHIGIESDFRPATKAHPALLVSDVAALRHHLEENGVRCDWDSALPGVKRLYAADPWGNRIEFLQEVV